MSLPCGREEYNLKVTGIGMTMGVREICCLMVRRLMRWGRDLGMFLVVDVED